MTDATGKSPPGESSEVTSIIQHTIKAGEQAAYEEWLREIVPVSTRARGYRGINVIRPSAGSTEYTVVLHFDTIDNLRAWLDSEERRKLVDKVQPCLVGESRVEIKTGLEFWFAPPSPQQRARPFKQFLVTLSVIYPLTILIPFLLHPLFERIPLLQSLFIQQFFIAAAIVALIIYVIMPRYTPLIAKWLYR